MAIFKAKIESNFVTIPNSTAQDKNLSFESRGMLAMLLSMPDDWSVNKEWLMKQSEAGRDKIQRIINELVEFGYMSKTQPKNQLGQFTSNDFFVYPTPVDGKSVNGLSVDGKSTTTKETVIQNKQDTNLIVPSETKRSKFKFSDEDLRFAKEMFGRVIIVNPAAKEPNFENWANTIRLMRESDNRNHTEMWRIFNWANKDSFWCSNILSPDKFRKQYDKLTVKANEANRYSVNATSNRKLTAEEERNQELLRKYGNATSPSGWANNQFADNGMDQREVQRGIYEPMGAQDFTIDLDSGDWSSNG